jgi:hypothetical protein
MLALAHQSKSPAIWNRAVRLKLFSGSDASCAALDVPAQVRSLVAIECSDISPEHSRCPRGCRSYRLTCSVL